MAKFYGVIGFAETSNTASDPVGVWTEKIVEREYTGDLMRGESRRDRSGTVNDNVRLANNISVVIDPYAEANLLNARYVTYLGTKWNIESAEIEYPRLIITIGGVYNG